MKRLYRLRRQAVIGGVCAGIAEYFQVDPTIVRLVWAATILLGGTGAVAYILAWLVIPPSPEDYFADDWPGRRPREPHIAEPADRTVAAEVADEAGGVQPVEADRTGPGPAPELSRRARSGPSTLGLVLILLGGFLLVRNLLPELQLHRFWPLAIVALGLWLIVSAVRGER